MRTYKTIQGQMWDEIAKEVYGTELNAGRLMAANPKLLDIFIFPDGVVVNIPDIEEKKMNLPPWR